MPNSGVTSGRAGSCETGLSQPPPAMRTTPIFAAKRRPRLAVKTAKQLAAIHQLRRLLQQPRPRHFPQREIYGPPIRPPSPRPPAKQVFHSRAPHSGQRRYSPTGGGGGAAATRLMRRRNSRPYINSSVSSDGGGLGLSADGEYMGLQFGPLWGRLRNGFFIATPRTSGNADVRQQTGAGAPPRG